MKKIQRKFLVSFLSAVSAKWVTIINQIIGSVISEAAYRVNAAAVVAAATAQSCFFFFFFPTRTLAQGARPLNRARRAGARAAAGSIKAARRLGAKRQVTQVNTAAPDTQALICRWLDSPVSFALKAPRRNGLKAFRKKTRGYFFDSDDDCDCFCCCFYLCLLQHKEPFVSHTPEVVRLFYSWIDHNWIILL